MSASDSQPDRPDTDREPELDFTEAPAGASSPSPPKAAEPDNESADLLDYLEDGHRQYGLSELGRVRAIGYFLPLMHEMFSGSEAKTKLVFSILHLLMTDDRVRWTRQELDELLHWLREGQRNYLLYRLSNVGWLEYFRDQGVYMVSDKGEALMRMLSRFVMGAQLVQNEGAALAEIEFSLLLELDDLPDRLKFLRHRLMKHAIRAEHALKSESAYRILEIYEQLKSAYRWAEQTRRTLDHLEIDEENLEQWDAVRGVHDHLSKLHSLISTMQVTLQDIQRKQIDIARYGLTHLDIDHYLIHSSVDELADIMFRHLEKIPHPFLVVEDNLFNEADDLFSREPGGAGTGRGWDTDVNAADRHDEPEEPRETVAFVRRLRQIPRRGGPVEEVVAEVPWEEAAYRFSLLTLLADMDPRATEAAEIAYDPLVNVPVRVHFDEDNDLVEVECQGEHRAMTRGRIQPLETSDNESDDSPAV